MTVDLKDAIQLGETSVRERELPEIESERLARDSTKSTVGLKVVSNWLGGPNESGTRLYIFILRALTALFRALSLARPLL